MAPFHIRPGMKFNHGGREYTVNGGVTLGVYEEGELYPWTEYMLESEDGDEFTLEFDDGQWIAMRDWKPEQRLEPEHMRVVRGGGFLTVDGIKMRVKVKAMAHLQNVEGDMDLAFPGETQWEYIDASTATELFSAEWTRERVNWVRGKRLSHAEVARGFGQNAYAPPSIGQHGGGAPSYNQANYSSGPGPKDLLGLGLLCFGLAFLAMLMGCSTSSKGKAVAAGQATVVGSGKSAVCFGPVEVDGKAGAQQLSAFVVSPVKSTTVANPYAATTPVPSTPAGPIMSGALVEPAPPLGPHVQLAKPEGYAPAPVGGFYAEGGEFRDTTAGSRHVVVSGNGWIPGTQVGFQIKQGMRGAGFLYFFALAAAAAGGILLLIGAGHIRSGR